MAHATVSNYWYDFKLATKDPNHKELMIHLFSSDPDSSSHIMLSCMINIRGNMTGGDAVKD